MGSGITLYDILGVTPGASSETIRRAHEAKARQLAPDRLADAPPDVLAAAARARTALDKALLILGDRAQRERYDDEAGIRGKGLGLVRPEPTPSRLGLDLVAGVISAAGALSAADAPGALDALADWLAPAARPPHRSRHVVVPDLRGLFFGPAQHAAGKAGLRIRTVRLTEQPLPVEGLVVSQSPPPGERVDRSSTLTIDVWHPPTHSAARS
jgi:curved DNA-binding protein CbpA